MTHPLCLLRSLWRSARTIFLAGIPTSGHAFMEDAVHHNCRVQVLRCKTCGKYDIAWEKETGS